MPARFIRACSAMVSALVVAVLPVVSAGPAAATAPVVMSSQSAQILRSLLSVADQTLGSDSTQRSAALSAQFLGVPYGANTLIGSATVPEQLVVDLQQVDCFTYADYVEALKRADDHDEFIDSLVDVRYKDGVVSYENRKHFFTDWATSTPTVATDITSSLSPDAVAVTKHLNQKDSGGLYLPGLPVVTRNVSYIPSSQVDSAVLSRLRTGDYLGAYATDGGLDVTHVGIFVDAAGGPVLRNASSLAVNDKVVDSPLGEYLQTIPGIVVLRPNS